MTAPMVDCVKGRDLPAVMRARYKKIRPDEDYIITIQSPKDYRSLEKIMDEIGAEAEARGMTPEILAEILECDIEEIT